MSRALTRRHQRLRPTRLRVTLLVALGMLVGAVTWWPMLVTSKGPTSDGRYFYYQFEAAKAAIRHFGEAPLWNPFDCRGLPMVDHPEAMVFSPLFVLLLPFSTTTALVVWQLVHLGIGFAGMWLLVRSETGASRVAAFVASAVYVGHAGAAAQYAGLHATLMGFLFLPLLLLLWRRAEHDVRAAFGLAAIVALMFYEGATYPLPFAALVLFGETLTRAWPLARLRRIATRAAIVLVTACGLAAARLLPVAERLTLGKRDIPPDVDQLLHAGSLWRMLTWREPDGFKTLPDQQYWWHEYIVYLGVAGFVLAALGLVVALGRHRWTVFVAAASFFLMAGHFSRWAPWPLLQAHVFPYDAMRVPSRFRHAIIVFACMWIALAIDRAPAFVARLGGARSGARALILALAVFAAGDTMLLSRSIVELRYQGDPPAPAPEPSPRFYYGGAGLTPDWMNQPSQNRAWTGCRTVSFPAHDKAPVWEGDVPQARALDDAVSVLSASRTNNAFDVEVDARRPGRILLDSAYDKQFHASIGEPMNHLELLSVDVPAGRHHVRVWYWPRLLGPGVALTGATLLGLGALAVIARRRSSTGGRRSGGASSTG